ncbi:dimethyl sulfoxide reductase anchor subunit family protein [Lentibacter sp. XHP0401]|jgi:sulfite dehydrogenase (quinone) subunit SoeC|uniref:dimethyl sulfoxide reductase anchor subunit family protein n=1 Tax=Lentibacter sp. XHP0401 TaxID=2984334 RepID=UPI0021E89651|nr:DmsC/YnfH family molybdoenzyme membrane anchor subunit [Lentibacter sp. XHP0401]MCV2893405.1 dimethyl sulfoxide reductase anchor subunit [Lentibacter sp. XHP0401]
MHPAPSVIAFTTLSGLGFGLLAFLGIGLPPVTGWVAFVFFFLGYALAVGGLLASVAHLANPKNAIKAFSQWRSSWLSREGIVAVFALLVMTVFAIALIFFGVRLRLVGLIGALLCLGTVFTTSMIYTQLKTVPRWNMWTTPPVFILHALGGGALLAGQPRLAAVLLASLGALMVWAWIVGDEKGRAGSTMETATGLGHIGKVRLLEPPHSGENYLLKEMAYQVGRKHAFKLRLIAFGLGIVLPVLLMLLLPVTHTTALVAILAHLVGIFAGRWLFFAEAEHVQALYYGR